MKKISFIVSLLSICLAGCLKDTPPNDFGTLKPIVELLYYDAGQTAHGGLENFSKDAVLTAGASGNITINFNANLASVDPLTKDLKVTIGVDDSKRIDYNNANPTKYVALPAAAYTLTSSTATVKAGSRLANFTISFIPGKIDPTQNYMLPISITDAEGQTISGNFGTIYFHMIGNPLAGFYNVNGTRYNYTGSISYSGGAIPTPVSTAASPSPKLGSPISPTVIGLDYANLGGSGYQYLVTYNPAATAPNQITVAPNDVLNGAVVNFTVYVKTYDPVTKTIHILSSYNNGTSDRIVDETFTHQ